MIKSLLKIMVWSAVALIIPLLGNEYVAGWNWTWGDFVFAWVFFVVMGVTIRLAIKLASTTLYRTAIAIIVFLLFAFIWIMLATG